MQTRKNDGGRGAGINPHNRFERLNLVEEQDSDPDFIDSGPKTQFIEEFSKTILSKTDSPDIRNFQSINPYRGCEHGCIYCYARNSHEYWGFSAGIDFETRIIVKKNAPQLLEKLFNSKSYQPDVIHLSGNTDCYQPAEKKFRLTRRLLEICLQYRNPVSILTKNALVLRDLDLLKELAGLRLVTTALSITSLDESVRRQLEPRTVTAKKRLEVIGRLHNSGIPVGVMSAPIIPGLTDHEIPGIIKSAADNGACWAGYTVVRLNGAISSIFEEWIHRAFPDRAEKVLNQIRDCHGGQLNDSRFGTRMRGEGKFAEHIRDLHAMACKKYLPGREPARLDHTLFKRGAQMTLF